MTALGMVATLCVRLGTLPGEQLWALFPLTQQTTEVSAIMIPTLQMRKLSLREVM